MSSLQASCEGAGHDFDENKLLDDQDKLEFTKLTEMVRCTYMNYLEKQLFRNFKTCYEQHGGKHILCDEEAVGPIKQTAKLLEDKAIAACMITQFYQKAMVKIISAVRRSTEENRLITELEKNMLQPVFRNLESCTKQTQTEEAGLQENTFETHEHELTLDEKIELFQSNLTPGIKTQPPVKRNYTYSSDLKSCSRNKKKTPKRTHKHYCHQNDKRRQYSPVKENLEHTSPTGSTVTPTQPLKSSDAHQAPHLSNSINESVADFENSNDSVAIELARLFSEEKTELDEIFGINPNENPDDPQICEILKEIEQAKVCHKQNPVNESEVCRDKLKSNTHPTSSTPAVNSEISQPKDLSKSLWPCELFMQRRKLSESLARLIEEDLRWHDLIKWRFLELFGADSDDEFTSYSPSIELDEILMGSCVKRISPWVVKYLMKPMNDGLIGNRFIFKKLAKHIARSIITENQYPDESVIKRCIENYFCLHQSVLSLDDYHFVPSISLF